MTTMTTKELQDATFRMQVQAEREALADYRNPNRPGGPDLAAARIVQHKLTRMYEERYGTRVVNGLGQVS